MKYLLDVNALAALGFLEPRTATWRNSPARTAQCWQGWTGGFRKHF
jgi:hypothetical protein